MNKFVSTTDCKWYRNEENGEFVLLVLSPNHSYDSEFYALSQLIFTCDEGVILIHENGERVLIPPFHLYHVKKNSKVRLLSHSQAEVVILTFYKMEFLCSKYEIIKVLSHKEFQSQGPSPVELKLPMQNFIDSMRYYLRNRLCCAHLQELKRRELSILFKNLYSIKDIGSILEELLLNSSGFRKVVLDHVESAKTVGELAQRSGYSLKTLERLFKEHYDTTPYKWMVSYKITRLKEMIANADIPIKMIVSSLGFTSASHLNTFCKKHFGMTPSVLRNHLINEI